MFLLRPHLPFPLRRSFCFSTSVNGITSHLKDRISELRLQRLDEIRDLKKESGKKIIGQVTADMLLGGMRGIKAMLCETSSLDPESGITYRNIPLFALRTKLPAESREPLSEGLLWFLLTSEIPSKDVCEAIRKELYERSQRIPAHVIDVINAMPPKQVHPMTQLISAVSAMQSCSKFAKDYRNGLLNKSNYWDATLEDSLDLIAAVPVIAAHVYNRTFCTGVAGETPTQPDPEIDWAANLAHMIGFKDAAFKELMRLYMYLHADHEGGNVSAHASHLVGSALSDPYLCITAALAGLAGPLHGLANQECLRWLLELREALGNSAPTVENVTRIAEETLASGKVIPGFGHAVLRSTDPRYICQREFALENMKDSELFQLVDCCYKAVPPLLERTGKVANPFPNVDAHSGALLHHFGLRESDYFTVLFGVSRTIGCTSQLVWARALGMPIERPKSLTLRELKAEINR